MSDDINKVKCTSHYFITLTVMISLDMIITIYHNFKKIVLNYNLYICPYNNVRYSLCPHDNRRNQHQQCQL